jgi:multidrug resistance protein, MATE family
VTEPITHARVLRIAAPIVLSNVTVPLLGLVDTGVVGQLGQAAPIGAVGLGAVILATFYWVFGFLRMGTTGLAAQARGAGDEPERRAILARALLIGLGAGVALILLQPLIFALALRVAPASAEVEALVRQYLAIRIWGAPATIAMYAITGWLIAAERTRGVLLVQVWMNGLNVGLDLWFVLGLGFGVGGVAVATLVAEWTGLALGFWLCRDGLRGLTRAAVLARDRLMRMLSVNGDIMIRSVLLQAALTSFMFLGAGQGNVALAANQVLMQFLTITSYALDGFAFAAEALVGAAVGAGSRVALRRSAVLSSIWAGSGAVLMGIGFWFAGPWLIDLLTTAPDVRDVARTYLIWAAAAPVIGIASWMLDGIFIGATWTRSMRNAMAVSLVVYVASLALLVPLIGNHGLWASMMIFFVIRALTLGWAYPSREASVGA